jgi:hypothetical protein
MKYLFILLIPILILPLFINISPGEVPVYNHMEIFDPSLSRLNSTQKLIDFADSSANINHIRGGSLGYGLLVASLIRKRFYHGFSRYSLQSNWIAYIAQYLCGHGLAAPVNPDDILKFPYAGCSQQAIVLMSLMKKKNIPYRSIGFPHHYATELSFGGNWYFFDPNMEPDINTDDRIEKKWRRSGDFLKKYYHLNHNLLNWTFGNSIPPVFGKINGSPAPNANIFQSVTKYLSKILWIFPFLFVVYPKKTYAENLT